MAILANSGPADGTRALVEELFRKCPRLLGELPPEVAGRIAWKNGARLFGLEQARVPGRMAAVSTRPGIR